MRRCSAEVVGVFLLKGTGKGHITEVISHRPVKVVMIRLA